MVIDAHTHLGLNNNKHFSAEDLVASMRDAGIDYSLVITNRHNDYSTMASVISFSKKHPQIKVIGDVSYADFETDEERIINYFKDGKIVGLKFYLGYTDYYPNDKKFDGIYAFCQENGYPVVYHTGILERGYKGLLKQSHPLNVDEVANRYPKLKIVMAHMGNPWLMDCAAVLIKNENVYADMSGFFAEYQPIAEEETELFIRQMTDMRSFMGGFEKMIFGTDYPLYNQKEYLDAVKRLPLTQEEKELAFWRNANVVYNLEL